MDNLYIKVQSEFLPEISIIFRVCIFIRTYFPIELSKLAHSLGTEAQFYKIRFSDFIPRAHNVTILCNFSAPQIVRLFSLNEKPEPSYYFCLPSVLESQLTQIIKRLSIALVVEQSIPHGY